MMQHCQQAVKLVGTTMNAILAVMMAYNLVRPLQMGHKHGGK